MTQIWPAPTRCQLPLRGILNLFAAAAMLFAFAGCNTVSTSNMQYLGVTRYPPSDPAAIQILHGEPTRPHVRLGEVRAEPSSTSVDVAKIETAVRASAAKLGADAIVIVYDQTQITGTMVTGPWWGRSLNTISGRVIIGVAIKFL